MMRGRLATVLVVASGLVCSCARSEPETRETENVALGGEVAARVGREPIPLSVVASVASAQNVAVREAVRRVVDDEIAAAAARAEGLDRRPPAGWRLVSVRGRFTADRLYEDAKRRGAPTDEEVRRLSEKHWVEVDRPPAVRVIHTIVLAPKDPALREDARALASELRAAVAETTDPDAFENAAKAVAHAPKLEIRVERLPAFTQEGRITEGSGAMDAVFAKAAFDLPSIGSTSPVVETGFGWHVIRLLEKLPENRMPLEMRRIAFTQVVYAMRARESIEALLTSLRASHPVSVSPAAEALMRSVTAARAETASAP